MLTALDIIVLALIGGGLVFGLLRGFVTEALLLFAWVAAIFMLKLAFAPATTLLTSLIGGYYAASVLAFLLIFGVTYVAGRVLAASLGRRTRQSVLGPVDRLLGAGFGALKGLLAATVLFLGANLLADLWGGESSARPEWLRASRTYPLLNASGKAVLSFVRHRREAAADPANGSEADEPPPRTGDDR